MSPSSAPPSHSLIDFVPDRILFVHKTQPLPNPSSFSFLFSCSFPVSFALLFHPLCADNSSLSTITASGNTRGIKFAPSRTFSRCPYICTLTLRASKSNSFAKNVFLSPPALVSSPHSSSSPEKSEKPTRESRGRKCLVPAGAETETFDFEALATRRGAPGSQHVVC